MSLGVSEQTTQMRALAHPTRLRILSLLTGAAMTAAEVARELGMTHANASYHLRQLLAAERIVVAGEERINGGLAKRYRHPIEPDKPVAMEERHALHQAIASELVRRSRHQTFRNGDHGVLTDADLWVDPAVWKEVGQQIAAASLTLHQAARPPRTHGTVRVNATIALFDMEPLS
jgi:DNA-binding transcriptional ArsR family regulator